METIFNITSKDFDNLNDFEIVKNNGLYSFYIETAYEFENKEYEKQHLKNILSQFCEWCLINNIDIFQELNYDDLFNIKNKFLSLEELYAYFRVIVNGYLNQ